MRIFKTTWFTRFANKEGILDTDLLEMVNQLEEGQADDVAPLHGDSNNPSHRQNARRTYVDLGGGVFKVRVARPGEGKSGGYRVIVFFKSKERTFFVYGFAKSNRHNLNQRELKAYKRDAKVDHGLTDEQINERLRKGTLIEIF